MTTATLDPIADQIRSGHLDEAKAALDSAVETDENRVELKFLRGYMTEMSFDREKALSCYQEVLDQDSEHLEAKFRAALLADSVGDEEAAQELYKSCVSGERVHVNALLNLAVLYEDASLFFASERCIKAVLNEHPNHSRARLLLKSVKSSFNMMYDETLKREQEQHSAILDTPVSDFELSVRSRNCLRQMNIATLGDLLDTTEAELLAYKNFGETSLNEIRAMLEQKQLKLGEALPMADPTPLTATVPVSPEKAAVLQSPVSALELSVRSRKCLQRLGIATLGELVQRSEAELTATKNFGQTSLNEITRQLAAFGLAFRAS